MAKELTRRSFLKATLATTGTISIGAMNIPFAAAEDPLKPVSASDYVAVPPAFVPNGKDTTYGTWLNPQEEKGFSDSGDLSPLFQPLKIGSVTLKNRICKSAAGSEMQYNTTWPSDTALAFYGRFADGGAAMICYEASTVNIPGSGNGPMPAPPEGAPMMIEGAGEGVGVGMFALDITTDEGIPAHRAIADYIHSHGSLLIAQLHVATGEIGASSSITHTFDLEMGFGFGKMQTTEEVQEEIKAFIDGSERYQKAGYDGVEINCSCNHYYSTFLSRMVNQERKDQYSGDTIENRARIITEIIEGIRERCGKDFVIQVLFSAVEENIARLGDNAYCTTVAEACEFAKIWEKAGADSFHVRSQAYGHHCAGFMPDVLHIQEHGHTGYGTVIDYSKHFGGVDGQHEGYGALIEIAAKVKSCVNVPVGTVGAMDPRVTPDLICNAIRDGKIDFILMSRPLMADGHYCKKLEEGRAEDIAPCTRCMTCFVAPFDFGTPMYCRVNASLSRAFREDMPEGYDPLPAETKHKVVVVGGGPAGMEAARIAAERGHDVVLMEKESVLGLTMDELSAIKGPHERIQDHKLYLVNQMIKHGVDIRTGMIATAETVKAEKPDSVIIAVGGKYTQLDVPGFDRVINANQLAGTIAGDSFVILGAQFQGCEAAVNLAKQGKKVYLINSGSEDELYRNGATWVRLMGKRWLMAKGVIIYHHANLLEVNADGVKILTGTGLELQLKADHVINAMPKQNNRDLYNEIAEFCPNVFAVGDCYSPGTIANGIARANIIARNVEKSQNGNKVLDKKENVYTATASGIGDVTVSIEVKDGVIVDAIVDTANETPGIGRDLGTAFASQILEKGSIDAVSGATITSDAASQALLECLKQAGLN